MGLRVRKSIQICKGVRLNFGLGGASVSFGTKGLRHTIHSSGRRTSSIGIPGTGISYTKSHGTKKKTTKKTNSIFQSFISDSNHSDSNQNEEQVQEYNELIDTLRNIHKTCDESINWQEILLSSDPFPSVGIGPKQAAAKKELDNYNPGFFDRLKSGDKRLELERAVEQAANEDLEDYENWRKLHELAKRVLDGDIDAYLEVIAQMNPLDDLLDFGADFEFGTDDPKAMSVEFTTKTGVIVPTHSLSLTKTGKLSRRELTKTDYYDIVKDYVCSCALRIARDVFALLPIETVVVHAVDNQMNTQTGMQEDVIVLSVLFDRDILNGLNFDNIDPSDAMNNFWHNMKFMKTAGFKPVEPIEDFK